MTTLTDLSQANPEIVALARIAARFELSLTGHGSRSKVMTDGKDWHHYHYTYELQEKTTQGCGYSMDGEFNVGLGWSCEPSMRDILQCLASDASLGDTDYCENFEEFCTNCGYDEDSRRAYSIYEQFVEQTDEFKTLLGDDYQVFIENFYLIDEMQDEFDEVFAYIEANELPYDINNGGWHGA